MNDLQKKLMKLLVAQMRASGKEIPPELTKIAQEMDMEAKQWVGRITPPSARSVKR